MLGTGTHGSSPRGGIRPPRMSDPRYHATWQPSPHHLHASSAGKGAVPTGKGPSDLRGRPALHRQVLRREVSDFRWDGVRPTACPATSRTLATAAKGAGVTDVRIQCTELLGGASGGAARLCGLGSGRAQA